MQTIRHLLCPVDLSEPAGQSLRYAAALSSLLGSDLTILYVRSGQADARKSPGTSLEGFARGIVGVVHRFAFWNVRVKPSQKSSTPRAPWRPISSSWALTVGAACSGFSSDR
jgi:hypothetical protein